MELNNVYRWLNLNKLSLNVNKTKAMVFHMPHKKIIQPNIQINGSNIEFVKNCVFLGITIYTTKIGTFVCPPHIS